MAGKIYSKDPKLKREIESARNYNINWAKKRKGLLKKNIEEMRQAFPMFINPGLSYLVQELATSTEDRMATNRYLNNRIKGYLNATVYGNPESFIAYNPDSKYTRDALNYAKEQVDIFKDNVTPEEVFNDVIDFDGLTFGPSSSSRIYVKNGLSGVAAHEFWHAGSRRTSNPNARGAYKNNPQHFAVVKYLKQDPYIKNLLNTKRVDWDKSVEESGYDNYLWNPDEVLARRASLMHYLNWNPTKKATLKDIQEWRRKGLLGNGEKPLKNNSIFYTTPYVGLDKLSDETILHLINDVALNNTPFKDTYLPNDVYYAYKGGLINKLTK